jgi:hypothetical protein
MIKEPIGRLLNGIAQGSKNGFAALREGWGPKVRVIA